jgi:hypothetical protein
MNTKPYTIGRQPCADFQPQQDDYLGAISGFSGNVHSCAGPFDASGHDPRFPDCEGTVSHCDNCHYDHHEGGFARCPVTAKPASRPGGLGEGSSHGR